MINWKYFQEIKLTMKTEFTLEEIERAILQSPKHIIEVKTPPYIDGNLDGEIQSIEVDMFWFRLLVYKT